MLAVELHARRAGKVRYIGISNCFAWQLAKANFYTRAHALTEFVSIQGHYNLIRPRGGTGNGALLRRSEYCHDALQRPGRRTALEAHGRDLQASGGEFLRQVQIRRCGRSGWKDHRAVGGTGRQARRLHDENIPSLAADKSDGSGGRRNEIFPCGRRGPSRGSGSDAR